MGGGYWGTGADHQVSDLGKGEERDVWNGFLIVLLKPPHAVGPSSPRSKFVGDKQW